VIDLLICSATAMEAELVRPHSETLITGVGAVNAACAVTRFLDRHEVSRIVVCGIGGAYPGSGLSIGDVLCAESECYGDLGVASPEGFLDMEALGFPLIREPALLYNVLPLALFPHACRAKFVTVNTCTGLDPLATAIAQRTGGAVENMEGAAVVHAATLCGVPVGEIRGISNLTGNRNRAAWKVREAAVAAQNALIEWIGAL
jgi:futalosine hydrolase